MIDIDELDDKFSIEGEVGFAEMDGDLVFMTLSNKFGDVDICLYGAHITSYRPHDSSDLLWMSPESFFEEGKAIRGGIPVCFPWFGPHKHDSTLPQHGFARLMYWEVTETVSLSTGETQVSLMLCSSETSKAYWPHDFCARLVVVLGQALKVTLKVTNTSFETFDYSCALHSYFDLSSLENLQIEGLQNTAYYNQLTGENGHQEEELLVIQEPMTRHYLNTEKTVILEDPIYKKKIRVAKEGSRVTTVWNPGAEASAAMVDLPDDGFETFVCLETVNAFNNIITLAPGQSHETTALISRDR